MIPRTFPSTIDANGNRSMVIFPITTHEPSGRWRDWIPVRGGTNSAKVNTYDEDGGQSMTIIDTLTNKQAWLDYVPVVFVGGNDADAWDVKDIGFIPGFGDVPAYNLNFGMLEFDRTGLSFTRAGDRSGTVIDNEGYIWACKANEMRMQGFRRVENLSTYSEALTSYSAYVQSLQTVTANFGLSPLNTLTSTRVQLGAGGYWYPVFSRTELGTYVATLYIRANTPTSVGVRLSNAPGTETVSGLVNVTTEWQRITRVVTLTVANTQIQFGLDTRALAGATGAATDVEVWGFQVEYAPFGTTTASEYVSNGVLSSPFHGYFADGVKYFTTDRNGDDIPEAARLGFLSEEASTNLLVRSEEFGTTWATGGTAVITSNSVVSPDGTQNADTYVPNSGVAGILQQTVTPAVAAHTFSCYIKRTGTTLNSIRLQATEGANFAFADFNLSTGATATGSSGMTNVSARISDADSNGWRRCAITFTTITAAATNLLLTLPTASGNAVDGFYLWGAQLEQKAFQTSIVPTVSATVTRSTDALTCTSAGMNWNVTEGTVMVDFIGTFAAAGPMFSGTAVGSISVVDNDGGNNVRTSLRSVAYTDTPGTATTSGSRYKTAYSFIQSNHNSSTNGGTVQNTTVATALVDPVTVTLGQSGTGTVMNSTIRSIRYFRNRLSNAVLQLVTA